MELNKDTRLLDILDAYPWLREELPKKDSRFALLDSALGRIFLKKATIGDLSKKADIPAEFLIEELQKMLDEHEKA
ncbi:MAG: hypothetical protein IJL99_04635 [Firmicutes bacterium]|nr:hypothetical protein [Bacillota bacterium]MBR0127528.1 hypothetical protein [Bacillota bacterium]